MSNKTYLTVGINKYSNAPLNGCVNDANDWANLLQGLGYVGSTLLDGTASKTTILTFLKENIVRLKYRDTFVFQYSGHGSWIPDRDGDEPDGRDEVMCAYDYENGGLISDDELYQITSQRAFGSRVIILSDSCHSGTVHRAAGIIPTAGVPNVSRRRVRYMPPGMFLEGNDLQRAHEAVNLPARGLSRRGSVLISGCADSEYSYDTEFNGRPNGAFSYGAIFRYELGMNIKPWYYQIRQELPTDYYPQTPQLQASWYQKTFWSL